MPRWLSRAVLAAAVAVVPVAAPTGAAAQAAPARQAHPNIARGHPAGAATLVTPTPGGYFPCDLAGAYRLGSVAGTGAGLTIAIVDAYDLAAAPADFRTFNGAFPTYFAGSAGSLHRLAFRFPAGDRRGRHQRGAGRRRRALLPDRLARLPELGPRRQSRQRDLLVKLHPRLLGTGDSAALPGRFPEQCHAQHPRPGH